MVHCPQRWWARGHQVFAACVLLVTVNQLHGLTRAHRITAGQWILPCVCSVTK